MNKIIKKYIETNEPLIQILKSEYNANEPFEVALLMICELIQIHSEEKLPHVIFEKIDVAIEMGHPDEEVFLIFISLLIKFYSVKEIPIKCESIFRISGSLNIAKYQPEIQAQYYLACSYYFQYTKNFEKREEAYLISISKLPKNNPRYPVYISSYGQFLGLEGRLQLLPKEDLALLEKLAEFEYTAINSLFRNATFTVNIKLIDKYTSVIIAKFKDSKKFKTDLFNSRIAILKGDLEERKDIFPGDNFCISYFNSLKKGDLESAKRLFGNIDKGFSEGGFDGIFNFINYHHAFVTGRYEIIENLIKMKEKQSGHYMLDFFLVRYFLIKEKNDLAKFYYTQLIKNCEKFQAMGRLKFEMQFAFELSGASFFELIQPMQVPISAQERNNLEAAMITPTVVNIGLNRIIGHSKSIGEIKKKVKKYADIQRPILVIGETGAGKEIVARAIHEESKLIDKPFLAINCGALTDTLLQSELFGYEAGAFTGAVTAHKGIFEAAEDGVVFLDEFGEMSQKLQVSLLRVLENNEILRVGGTKVKKINCRIIAATNADIEDLISKKLFREDLYQRLKQFTILIPPLRVRKEDIPELIQYFLNQQNNDQLQVFSSELLLEFQEYHWPGNIRELKNEVDRIKILCGYKPIIELKDIEIEWLQKKVKLPAKKDTTLEDLPNNLAKSKYEQMHQRILNKKLNAADKRSQQIMLLFQQYKQLTRSQIAEALEVCSLTVTRDLKRLTAEGLIIKRKPTLSSHSHFFEIKE